MDIIIRDVEEVGGRYKVKYKDGAGGFFYVDKQTAEAISIPIEPPVMLNFADDEKTILKSIVMLKILQVQQAIDEDIFSLNDESKLQVQLMLLKKILSKISA